MYFDIFVIPFSAGILYLLVFLSYKYSAWILQLPAGDKSKLRKSFFSRQFFVSVKEVINECLLHRKVFKVNPLLGYMHMSLAFGWFLLIVCGNLETRIYSMNAINPPYYPIFFKFFDPVPGVFLFSKLFEFLMDFLLLFVLSGVFLAMFKRFRSSVMGMKKTTTLKPFDKLALTSLWLIFPFRLLAESFTSGAFHHGGFLTGSLGLFFSGFLPVADLYYSAWWAYSISLCGFFIALPFSRYMHIPTEVLLIFMRNAGISLQKENAAFAEVELNSCSRCGICIDTCQLSGSADIQDIQTVYFIRDTRHQNLKFETVNNCLMCGRCDRICPVGLDAVSLRQKERINFDFKGAEQLRYLPAPVFSKTEVLYFAGCMTHLTPSVIIAMNKILKHPMKNLILSIKTEAFVGKAGQCLPDKRRQQVHWMQKNKELIQESGAGILVTSCPICYNVFLNEYKLDIEVLHHSQYLLRLIDQGKIEVEKSGMKAIYHDPCELGRGMNIYEEPRQLIQKITGLDPSVYEKENSFCCGGSIGNCVITDQQRNLVAGETLQKILSDPEQTLITACPLCKKTFKQIHNNTVDIAQITAAALK